MGFGAPLGARWEMQVLNCPPAGGWAQPILGVIHSASRTLSGLCEVQRNGLISTVSVPIPAYSQRLVGGERECSRQGGSFRREGPKV